MDIERLKELRELITDGLYSDWSQGLDEDWYKRLEDDDERDLLTLIDSAMQAVSEDVQRAINDLDESYRHALRFENTYTDLPILTKTSQLAIQALQAYQPWVSVEDRLPIEDDADGKGNIMAYFADGAIETWEWDEIGIWNDDSTREYEGVKGITHWRSMLPQPPKGE